MIASGISVCTRKARLSLGAGCLHMRAGPESFGSQVEAGEGISGLGFRAYRVCSRAAA